MLQENQQPPFEKKKFTQKPIGVIFWLWLFFPVGIYFMWKGKMWSSKTRIIITSVFGFFIILALAGKKNNTVGEASDINAFDISKPYNIDNIKIGTILEFKDYSGTAIDNRSEPSKMTITFIDNNRAEVYYWNKGYPNNAITEEKLVYSYRIVNSYNLQIEYDWEGVDSKVILLENMNAGWSNRKLFLEKRFFLSNAFNKEENSKFLGFRVFKQLDGGGSFLNAGDLISVK